MAIFKCKMCGGALEVADGITVAACDYCGTKQTLPTVQDEALSGLFNRANILRMKSEFDKAEQIYEKIIRTDSTQAEAYWGLILCKFGIEYVEDPATYQRVPTCHRTSLDSIVADEDYKAALQYADSVQRSLYEAEAKEIDRLQKEIIALSQKEEPYDVFICYKETDANGNRTPDSVIANDIYYQLTQEGLKVFYAAISLEDKLGSAYEPCIFAALNSAKVMLVVGTKPEHFNAVWVKNEWSRFLKMMKGDRSKLLIPCYRDMDAYELPEEFAHLQAQDMSKIGFVNDVVRGIKKVVDATAPQPSTVVKETVTVAAAVAPLLKRAFLFLEDGDFDRADDFCEQVLNQDPECADAYLGKLLAELRVNTRADLKALREPFDHHNNYQKALRFGDDGLKAELQGSIEHIHTRNEQIRLERAYQTAKSAMEKRDSEARLREAAELLESLGEYLDAAQLAEQCLALAEEARKNEIYDKACAVLAPHNTVNKGSDIRTFLQSIEMFRWLDGWKDSEEKIKLCQEKIEKIKQLIKEDKERQEQERLVIAEQERQAAIKAARDRRIGLIIFAIICAILVFVYMLLTVIIPNSHYNDAVALMDEGKYHEAMVSFYELDGYKDSQEKLDGIVNLLLSDTMTTSDEGLFFGSYAQHDSNDGKDPIQWVVLDVREDKVLLTSKHILDYQSYDGATWASSGIREWLNDTFFNEAFSKKEQEKILSTNHTDTNERVQDKVFLLSESEANQYFDSDEQRACTDTFYAGELLGSGDWWMLRNVYASGSVAYVHDSGKIDVGASDANSIGVRPAIWISLK